MSGDAIPLCPKCRKAGWHYVAPRLGAPGYYACPEPELSAPDPNQMEAFAALAAQDGGTR